MRMPLGAAKSLSWLPDFPATAAESRNRQQRLPRCSRAMGTTPRLLVSGTTLLSMTCSGPDLLTCTRQAWDSATSMVSLRVRHRSTNLACMRTRTPSNRRTHRKRGITSQRTWPPRQSSSSGTTVLSLQTAPSSSTLLLELLMGRTTSPALGRTSTRASLTWGGKCFETLLSRSRRRWAGSRKVQSLLRCTRPCSGGQTSQIVSVPSSFA
mmetsp:Transcript_89103/g.224979  ORF Transcript_89103/g.224979 Transcript_89103/m.224979 type:complete len:210 (+) Transcript_89103:456-1085(+)